MTESQQKFSKQINGLGLTISKRTYTSRKEHRSRHHRAAKYLMLTNDRVLWVRIYVSYRRIRPINTNNFHLAS